MARSATTPSHTSGLRLTLVCLLALVLIAAPGCGVSQKYHDRPGQTLGSVKVFPFWRGEDGHKYVVGDLKVTLTHLDGFTRTQEKTTTTIYHAYFDNLQPGRYRVRVHTKENMLAEDIIEVKSEKMITVRVDVQAVRQDTGGAEDQASMGSGAVKVAGTLVSLAILAAVILAGGEDEKNESVDSCCAMFSGLFGGDTSSVSAAQPEK